MATLLLADDSVTIQRVIALTFADEDVRVIAVGDGESAIARFEEERPDIVLADVGMPGVDVYEVATHVKRSDASGSVPVLLLAGAFEPIDEARARATGCDGVLVKPFEPRQLVKTVRGLLSGERPQELWPADLPRVPVRAETPAAVVPPYDAESDPDLAAALARLEFVAVPEAPIEPDATATPVASPLLTEAAIEEVVQRVVRRMTDEQVRAIVLETAERLIREEIDRIKA